MKFQKMFLAMALFATVALTAFPVTAADPGAAAYKKALAGKRVLLVPMAMGFDLAQGWATYLKREVRNFGGIFETRDPNWSVEAGAQAITEAIASNPKPDVMIIMAPDLNSYSKLMKRAQKAGIYIILIDNPANFKADAYVGGDWTEGGRLEALEAMKACGENSSKEIGLVQGDQTNATSLYQYAGIMEVLNKHPEYKVVAKPDSNWDATTSRNVTATMLQQHPNLCAIIDFWDGDATGAAAAIRDAGKKGKIALIANSGGEQVAACDMIKSGDYHAVVMNNVVRESEVMVAIIKFLLQSGQPAGTSHTYIYSVLQTVTKDNLKCDTCWDLKALKESAK
ncbi:MAG: sugar ABC transporter substrate-binding protein [Deltaproteobacteria bacterium]|nr:MAG: sugar ABC transporter substrate-binding protein [Deltaproteobacteria bacterium]RUA00166.1 MAG: sugar ABC transporter substrate-binding protein [Deltaproteobacteria bacterium]